MCSPCTPPLDLLLTKSSVEIKDTLNESELADETGRIHKKINGCSSQFSSQINSCLHHFGSSFIIILKTFKKRVHNFHFGTE